MPVNEDRQRPLTYGDLVDFKLELTGAFGDLDRKVDRVAIDVARMRGDMFDLENRFTERMMDKAGWLMSAVTKFHDDTQTVDRREVVLKHRVDELEDRVKALEEERPQ